LLLGARRGGRLLSVGDITADNASVMWWAIEFEARESLARGLRFVII
jgi:hypothetical protein